jgi:hypothetical protein
MQHRESSIVVYYSTEYARFKMLNGNRQLNERKIKKIISEIANGNDMLRYKPIEVKENKDRLEILDGQHRFYISKYLKKPVYYILVDENKTMVDIAKINSNVDKWKGADFLNCYIQQGNADYERLRLFSETYEFSLSVSLKLLAHGHPGSEGTDHGSSEEFKNGSFQIKYWDEAVKIAVECKKFYSFHYHRERSFVIAIYRIMKASIVAIDKLVKAYEKKPEQLLRQPSYKEYIWNLEHILNIGNKTRIVII